MVAALAASTVSVSPAAQSEVPAREYSSWNILLDQQGVPPAPFLWAGRQQVNEKHLQPGKNKADVCCLKEREEAKLSKTCPQAA